MTDESRKQYDAWLQSQQGVAYDGSYQFAWAAWKHLTSIAAEREAALQARVQELEYKLLAASSTSSDSQFGRACRLNYELTVERDQLRAKLDAIAEKVGPSPELPEPHRTPAKAYALINWYQHAAEHAALKVVESDERNKALADGYAGSSFVAGREEPLLKLHYKTDAQAEAALDAFLAIANNAEGGEA